jgi:hypothetical protein
LANTALICCVLFALICPLDASSLYKRKQSKIKRGGKYLGGILATSASFMGLDTLASYLNSNPESSIAVFIAIILLLILLLITAIRLILLAYRHFNSRSPPEPIPPSASQLTEFELTAIKSLLKDHR